jgi:uncharacterized repeat protein (TIGR02543 family)
VKDTPTKISLDDRVSLSVSLQSNSLYVKLSTISVTFDSQGGTAVDAIGVSPDANGRCKIPVPTTPTRDGYTFVGWVVGNPNNSKIWDFNTFEISYGSTLYAKWQQN